jgi:hypothetical protein
MSWNITRAREHYEDKCKSKRVNKSIFRTANPAIQKKQPHTANPVIEQKQTQLNIPRITGEHKAKLDQAFARACQEHGYALFELPQMKEAMRILNPAYTLPSREEIARILLKSEELRLKLDRKRSG